MADYYSPILQICRDDMIRRRLFAYLSIRDLCTLRLASTAFSNLITHSLFTHVHLTFSPSSLTKPGRLEALARIGHHVNHLTFSMHHSEFTFLPPLLGLSGQEVQFLYTPHTSLASENERPKYGNSELGTYLTQQYPAIFHSATNVPSFIRFISCLPTLNRISISCPGQEPGERYRRSAVDYALISLRIAIERARLPKLEKLSLAVHPAALLYLSPTSNFGASPSSLRRWRQIKNMKLSIDSWPFESSPPDHLKLLSNYLRSFSNSVEKLTFHWYGARGPCPVTAIPPASRPSTPNGLNSPIGNKLFAEITSPMSPLPFTPPPEALHFPRLRRVAARNTHVSAEAVSSLITRHAGSLKSLDLDNVVLTHGTWDEALAPLGRLSTKEAIWEARHSGSFTGTNLEFLPSASSSFSASSVSEEENPYEWIRPPSPVVLSDPFVDETLASNPTHVNIHKKHRKRRRRRTASPPPPPTLKHQASSLLGKLKKEASQSSFLNMFRHHNHSEHSYHSIEEKEEVVDDFIPPRRPSHRREMPEVPQDLEVVEEEGVDFVLQNPSTLKPAVYTPPATRHGKIGSPPQYRQAYVETPPQTPTSPTYSSYGSEKRNSFGPLLPTTYAQSSNMNMNQHPAMRTNPYTPPRTPETPEASALPMLSPTVYSPTTPTRRPKLERMPPLSPLPSNGPCTPWPCTMAVNRDSSRFTHRSATPKPLNLSNVKLHYGVGQAVLDPTVQGNQRDHIREEQWDELAQNSNLRLNAVQSAKERVLARLGGRYSPEKKVEREMRREERKGRGGVMDEVRKEMFGGDGEGWIGESNIVREGSVRGRDRESVPLMIFR